MRSGSQTLTFLSHPRPECVQHAQAPDFGPHPAFRRLPGGQATLAGLKIHTALPLLLALQ